MPRRLVSRCTWAAPLVRARPLELSSIIQLNKLRIAVYEPTKLGKSKASHCQKEQIPNQGHSPSAEVSQPAGHSHRLTSGGIAVVV